MPHLFIPDVGPPSPPHHPTHLGRPSCTSLHTTVPHPSHTSHTCSHLIPHGSLKATSPTPATRLTQLYAPLTRRITYAPASNRKSTWMKGSRGEVGEGFRFQDFFTIHVCVPCPLSSPPPSSHPLGGWVAASGLQAALVCAVHLVSQYVEEQLTVAVPLEIPGGSRGIGGRKEIGGWIGWVWGGQGVGGAGCGGGRVQGDMGEAQRAAPQYRQVPPSHPHTSLVHTC